MVTEMEKLSPWIFYLNKIQKSIKYIVLTLKKIVAANMLFPFAENLLYSLYGLKKEV